MPQKNEARALKTRQIEKNPALTLGMSEKDVSKYKKIAAAYGNVTPVIVSAPKNGTHLILEGSARLEAIIQTGIQEIPAVMVQDDDEARLLKLALTLSALRDESSVLSEGALIIQLINAHGVSQRELCFLLGKSKAWVSKRVTLTQNLAESVKGMVTDGALYPRSAEEVAKLPKDTQTEFAANVIHGGLSKTEISWLVQRYKNANSDEARREIIQEPLKALSKMSVSVKNKRMARSEGNHSVMDLSDVANYATRMTLKAINMAVRAEKEILRTAETRLIRLRGVAAEASETINRLLGGENVTPTLPEVSPGKPEDGFSWDSLIASRAHPWDGGEGE